MKLSTSIAASILITASAVSAWAEECTGPFRECAFSVNAQCSRDTNGEQRMSFIDARGQVSVFEKCVGRVFEAAGQPNPYKTGVSAYGDLSIPMTELIVPHSDP